MELMQDNEKGLKQELVADSLDYENFDFDAMEEVLNQEVGDLVADLELLNDEREKIDNPEELGKVVQNVIMEQVQNQLAATVGEEFIKENHGNTLDLRNSAHIQTAENFAEGKIATHNTEIDYQQRYDDWQSNFVKDENGNVVTHQTRSGKEEATLVKGARKPFDEGRPTGSVENHTDMDHTVSAAEIIRDPAANAHMTKEEQIAFANSDANLNEMDSSLNRSKGDKSMTEWLDNPNANGQKPDEIFDISAEDDAKMRQKDAEAREEYEKQKKEAEQKSIEAGKKSRKEEAFRIGGKALRAVLMQLLAELVREIIAKLVKWFKSGQRKLKTLLDALKEAIHKFVGELKAKVINAGKTSVMTIVSTIVGPVFSTLTKVWTMLKQSWQSLKGAIDYLRNPENKSKSLEIRLMEAGKIVIAGMSGIGAMVLSETIEKGLMTIPIFTIQIPLLGSLANVLGMFFGAVISGLIGAIALNIINKLIAKKQKSDLRSQAIDKNNQILRKQEILIALGNEKLEFESKKIMKKIDNRHREANKIAQEALEEIFTPVPESDYNIAEMQADLEDLLK